MSETAINILLVILVIGALALNIYIKARRTGKTPLGRVARILMNVNYNERLVENFGYHSRVGKLKTGAWQKNKDKLEFLPQELRQTLSHVFEMSEDINGRIDAARKFKSDSYMAGIDVSKIKEPLARSKEELQVWLQANMQNPEYQPKRRRGLFG